MIFAVDRAGLNVADGATHHGIFDVSFLSAIPNMTIFTPSTYESLERAVKNALQMKSPVAIRYPNAMEDDMVKAAFYSDPSDKSAVRSFGVNEITENIIITHGRMASVALDAMAMLEEEGVNAGILLCEFIKPYDKLVEILSEKLPEYAKNIIFLEEEIMSGGFGMNLSSEMKRQGVGYRSRHKIIAVDDDFVIPEKGETVWQAAGVDAASVCEAIISLN